MAAQNTPTQAPRSWLVSWVLCHRCSSTIFALENHQMCINAVPRSPGTPATAESTPELPFHSLQNCRSAKPSGKRAGGWDTGYVALYINPTIVNAAINYPHGPLQQRKLYKGDGEEC